MSFTHLERITERVMRNGDVDDPETPRPLLTLAEFFDGNDVIGSIGCNLTPTPAEVYSLLQCIAARPDVADVRVQVTMFDDPAWPFSDTVWIMTSASAEDVWDWFDEHLRPDECWEGWTQGVRFEPYSFPVGMHPVGCCWD